MYHATRLPQRQQEYTQKCTVYLIHGTKSVLSCWFPAWNIVVICCVSLHLCTIFNFIYSVKKSFRWFKKHIFLINLIWKRTMSNFFMKIIMFYLANASRVTPIRNNINAQSLTLKLPSLKYLYPTRNVIIQLLRRINDRIAICTPGILTAAKYT